MVNNQVIFPDLCVFYGLRNQLPLTTFSTNDCIYDEVLPYLAESYSLDFIRDILHPIFTRPATIKSYSIESVFFCKPCKHLLIKAKFTGIVDTLIHPNLFSTFFSHVGIPISSIKVVIGQKEHPMFSLPAQICIAFLTHLFWNLSKREKKNLVDLLGLVLFLRRPGGLQRWKTPIKKNTHSKRNVFETRFFFAQKIQDWDKANRNLQRGNQHMHLWHLGFPTCWVGPFFLHFRLLK